MNRHDTKTDLIFLVIGLLILFFIVTGLNTCSEPDWNDGICPKCAVRYELRGVSGRYIEDKHYVCPRCGKEVTRYS